MQGGLISRLSREREATSCGKGSEAENGRTQVEIMPGAVLQSPAHFGKQVKCFADMRKNHDDHTTNAEHHQVPAHKRERGSVAELHSTFP
jgi:hypothetical protein